MKKLIFVALAVTTLIAATAAPSLAYRGRYGGYWHGGYYGHGSRVGVGVMIGPGWDPWWGGAYYPYYPYYPYYTPPPVVIEREPDTYIQQQPPPAYEEQNYWYFCREPQGYYPYVKKCPKGWLKVVPPSAPEDEEE
ncbi:MAG TPA: hypothetical protein VF799_00060 [Geobacteraceae bacterium]